jgi:hypothetical protein
MSHNATESTDDVSKSSPEPDALADSTVEGTVTSHRWEERPVAVVDAASTDASHRTVGSTSAISDGVTQDV